MNKYLRIIDFYINKLNKEEFAFQDRLDFLNQFKYDYESLIQEKTSTVFKLFYVCFSKMDMTKINYFIDRIKEYIDKITGEDFLDLNKIYEYFSIVLENSSPRNYLIDFDTYENMLDNFKKLNYPKEIELFLINMFSNEEGIMDIKSYNYFLNYLNSLNKLNIFKSVNGLLEIQNSHVETMNSVDKIKTDKIIKKLFPCLLENIEQMQKVRERFISDLKSYNKNKKKIIDTLNIEREKIINNQNVNYQKIFQSTNEPILTLYMLEHNNSLIKDEYNDTLKNIDMLKKDNINNKERILNKYDCNVDINKILINDDELEQKIIHIMEFIPNIKKYNNIMLILLNNITYEELRLLVSLIINKDLNESFILNNINMIKNNIKELTKNIKLLKKYNLSIRNIVKYDENILFLNNNYLKNILKSYDKYGISYDYEIHNYEFLKKDYSYIIDKYIEIGEYDLIKNNISLANESSELIIKRCIFNKEINEPILNKDNKLLGNLRKEDNYLLTNEELLSSILENYEDLISREILTILNNTFNIEVPNFKIDLLEEYSYNNLYYNFNGMIVSKNKVLKNYYLLSNTEELSSFNEKEKILYSIYYNYPNIITRDNINFLYKILNIKIKSLN